MKIHNKKAYVRNSNIIRLHLICGMIKYVLGVFTVGIWLRFLWEFDCCYCLHNLKLFVCLVHVLVLKQFLTSIQQPWIIYYINLICNAKSKPIFDHIVPNVLSHWCWFKVKIRIDGWFVRKTFNRAILLKKNHISSSAKSMLRISNTISKQA